MVLLVETSNKLLVSCTDAPKNVSTEDASIMDNDDNDDDDNDRMIIKGQNLTEYMLVDTY